ncbi:MAG: S-layer homology domain-containing protein [Clostridiales bacterium]|nr:S-layer homology domain-containing protein [Clostridiales bacterium]
MKVIAMLLRVTFTAGIISGFGDGTFAPESLLTKEQLAVILYKYAKTLDADTIAFPVPREDVGIMWGDFIGKTEP